MTLTDVISNKKQMGVNMTEINVFVSSEVTVKNAADFNFYARLLGVDVPARGRKPFAKLYQAIQSNDAYTLVETEYFNATTATATANGNPSDYGARKRALIAVREAAIQEARDTYSKALAELRAELELPAEVEPRSAGNAYLVQAKTPVLDKTDPDNVTVKRTVAKGDKPGKVRFGPSKSVTVTPAEVRELAPTDANRGKLSKAHTLYAAAVKGGWVPRDLMATDGWESVLLEDYSIEPTTVDAE